MKFFISFLCLINVTVAQTWSQLSDLPANERDDGVAAVISNAAYVGTGLATNTGISNDFYRFDLSTNNWSAIASMPMGSNRQYASAFAYSNYLFVTCGITSGNTVLNDTYRYDVTANTWTTVVSKPGNPVWGACSFTLNSKAYLFGGKFSNGSVSDEVWEYDMTSGTWTQKNNFPFGGRWRASSALLNNSPYVIFGLDNNGSYRKEIYKYTQSTDSWVKIADFPQPNKGRIYAAMQGLANKLVIFGGHDTTGQYFNDSWFFDEVNGFVQGPVMPALPRKGGMSFSNGSKFYYTCGLNNTPARTKETWMLDVPVGLKEIGNEEEKFMIYPNPCQDAFTISAETANYKIEMYAVTGEKIQGRRSTQNPEIIDVADLPAGVYFLRVSSEYETFSKKIIKN